MPMPSSRRRRQREPLDVQLTVDVIFGDAPEERVRMIDGRHVPMVNSIFEKRDTVMRQFAMLMLHAGVSQPKVMAELVPMVKLLPALLHRGRQGSAE
ncbi:MAG: hypothetical protein EPN72_01765 [Nevskiaceae bacterium]|nr:MAG: hypothetical protein EPN63_12515 [Nevskiaceae bacterium]TBR74764.1 MAG: hypothetical protein EPN72_01765 [Nevskiaceae bacterium]